MTKLLEKQIHPVLLTIYPLVALYANNLGEVDLEVVYRPLLLCILGSTILYAALWAVTRDRQKAGIVTSLLIILFFSYGHVYNALSGVEFMGVVLRRHRYLLPVWILIAGGGCWFFLRRLKAVSAVVQFMNVFAVVLLLFPLFQLTTFYLKANPGETQKTHDLEVLSVTDSEELPDIYYIILDSYVRKDILLDYYGYDNTSFYEELEELGFSIPICTKSNYVQTELSLSSSLNYHYLHELGDGITEPGEMTDWIQNSAVRLELEEIGYTSIAFETGFSWSQITNSTLYLKPNQGILSSSVMTNLQPFESMLIKSTMGLVLVDFQNVLPNRVLQAVDFPYQNHIERQFFILNMLKQLPSRQGPKFIFAHLIVPHPPFVFKADGSIQEDADYYRNSGSPVNDEIYKLGYVDQVKFINKEILSVLESILSTSPREPIIILQADHGDGLTSSPAILNAYHLPENGEDRLYPSISPVNTFRLIFSEYFGADLPFIEDVSRVSTYEKRFDFTIYEDPNPACQ